MRTTDVKREKMVDQLFDYGVRLMGKRKLVVGSKTSLPEDFGVKQDLFYAELKHSLLFQNANPKLVIQEVAKFPEVRRDLSLV